MRAERTGLRAKLYALHDRLLANPRFQRWAAGFALTRPVAHRRSRALFDICAGFVYSQVLFACVQLNLFKLLAAGPQTAEALAGPLTLPVEGARRLLLAATSLRLVSRRGDHFGLGVLGAAMLGNPAVTAMVQHHALLYADLLDPVALLRGDQPSTALANFWPYAGGDTGGAAEVANYSVLMAESQALVAADVLEVAPLQGVRCLMDVGGGEGAFLLAAARHVPALKLQLFDLPAVADRARRAFEAAGIAERATAIGGDFRRDPLPTGADAISLVRVLHDHDDGLAQSLLRAAHEALPAGGRILIAEPMSGTAGAEPIGDAYFGFYLMAMGSGRPRTAGEIAAMLHDAGFHDIRTIRTRRPMLVRLVTARA